MKLRLYYTVKALCRPNATAAVTCNPAANAPHNADTFRHEMDEKKTGARRTQTFKERNFSTGTFSTDM